MDIRVDDLNDGQVISLLEEHLDDMYATSPAESVHALDVEALKVPDITFFSGWDKDHLLGCVAIKKLSLKEVELKSMRTISNARNRGVASKLLTYALEQARLQGYILVYLETGSDPFFQPARSLYEKFGFGYCGPFGAYKTDPHSCFMTREL